MYALVILISTISIWMYEAVPLSIDLYIYIYMFIYVHNMLFAPEKSVCLSLHIYIYIYINVRIHTNTRRDVLQSLYTIIIRLRRRWYNRSLRLLLTVGRASSDLCPQANGATVNAVWQYAYLRCVDGRKQMVQDHGRGIRFAGHYLK